MLRSYFAIFIRQFDAFPVTFPLFSVLDEKNIENVFFCSLINLSYWNIYHIYSKIKMLVMVITTIVIFLSMMLLSLEQDQEWNQDKKSTILEELFLHFHVIFFLDL